MQTIERDTLFVALTRPQMFAGVTYSYFVANIVLATEGFLIFRSIWVLAAALFVHVAGMLLCLHEPRFFDLWLTRVGRCPRIRNHAIWRCNSYRP
jgi:type IV secretion system protein VirB3